jgi:hypothetical protein
MEFNTEAFDAAMNELSAEFEKHIGILALVTGKVAGKDYWAYAMIPPQNWPAFQYVQSQGGYDLGEYASEILAQGKGKTPPKETLVAIKTDRPDIDFGFEKALKELLVAA